MKEKSSGRRRSAKIVARFPGACQRRRRAACPARQGDGILGARTGQGAGMSDYDSPWKEALEYLFRPFLAFCFPQPHAEIAWDRGYESLDKELRQIAPDA